MGEINYEILDKHVFVTKLAGFEHTEYIQKNQTKEKNSNDDIPMVQGKNIRNGFFVEEYDWYINKDISIGLDRSRLTKDCILVPYVGSNLGEVGIFYHKYDCHLASNVAKIELVDDYFDLEYLKYYLQSPIGQGYLFQAKQGSAQPNITMEAIRNTKVIDLPKNKQLEIVKILNNIDFKFQNNNKIINELELMAKTLYDYWFLQFEFLNEEGKPYKSSGGKMVYNEELKREIPEGWKVENMMESSLCSDIKAGVDKFESKNYLPTANIEGESITDGEYVTFDNRENRANMQPVKYSVWFAKMKNSIKHLSIPENSEWFINKYILSTGFQGLKCTKTSFAYIHSIINSSWFETYKDILSHGATQEGVNNEDLKNIKYVVPSNNVLIEFNKICMPALEKKFSIIRENQELVSLRDFLLPMLMNGQVTFK